MTRVAVVADIHGSLAALEAVIADLRKEAPDIVVHGGDLVASGPRPAEVIDTIRELGWPGVMGNTDEMLWRPRGIDEQLAQAPKLETLLRVLFEAIAPATAERIGDERMLWLKTLPHRWTGNGIALVHASPGDLWRAPMPNASDAELAECFGSLEARTVIYCHIHNAYVRWVRGRVVANTGSVGLPYDGDPRASYVLVEDDVISLKRVEYDIGRDVEDLVRSNYPFAEWLAEIRTTGRYAPPSDRPSPGG